MNRLAALVLLIVAACTGSPPAPGATADISPVVDRVSLGDRGPGAEMAAYWDTSASMT